MAIKFEKLSVGMKLYSVASRRAGNTTRITKYVITVTVTEMDAERRGVWVQNVQSGSRNYIPERRLGRYRVKAPELIQCAMPGVYRLKRRNDP